jgi:hypothetical protein
MGEAARYLPAQVEMSLATANGPKLCSGAPRDRPRAERRLASALSATAARSPPDAAGTETTRAAGGTRQRSARREDGCAQPCCREGTERGQSVRTGGRAADDHDEQRRHAVLDDELLFENAVDLLLAGPAESYY